MNSFSVKNGNTSVEVISSAKAFNEMVGNLQNANEIAFDTEFDRFRRGYGFTLYLLQIFDGRKCYVVDALRLEQLRQLWSIFESDQILKVAYSCREDIEILKINGCSPKNIFDVQIAAALANSTAQSFSGLVEETFAVKLDKSQQTSDWKKRPLSLSQLLYASNDVIHLLRLKEIYREKLEQIGLTQAHAEEVETKISAVPVDFTPRLTPSQLALYSDHHLEVLNRFFQLRDKYGRKFNMPPKNLVGDSVLEDILKDSMKFIANPFQSGFSKRALADEGFVKEFLEIAGSISTSSNWRRKKVYVDGPNEDAAEKRQRDKYLVKEFCVPIKKYVGNKYGEVASDFILRGLRRKIDYIFSTSLDILPYQRKIIMEAMEVLQLPQHALVSYNEVQRKT